MKNYTFKTHQQCDAEAERERTRAGGRGVDTAGRVEDLSVKRNFDPLHETCSGFLTIQGIHGIINK
jgi:hypothetical protein